MGRKTSMIDLHMHTTYSDGTDTVKELLKNAQKRKLEVISITDHNGCRAYQEMETFDIANYYKGDIIVGCEFTTSFAGRLIEVLGYGFDYQKVDQYLSSCYSAEKINETTRVLYQRLLAKISDLGLTLAAHSDQATTFDCEFFERKIYDELTKYPENKKILPEDIWDSFSDFFRKGLTNPASKLFINHAEFKPALSEIIRIVHEAGGIVMLAHPFQYKFTDTESFLDNIYEENDFDGVECFYTTFSRKQTEYLVNFAKKRNLLISGGSDYHGTNKKQHELGIGRGNLAIRKDILTDWKINYYKEEIR
ncbi:MAG: PHP domain-containing protein [Bacilli bacterium]|nr:PHP domain-containing protein [Bacilli bacterium]